MLRTIVVLAIASAAVVGSAHAAWRDFAFDAYEKHIGDLIGRPASVEASYYTGVVDGILFTARSEIGGPVGKWLVHCLEQNPPSPERLGKMVSGADYNGLDTLAAEGTYRVVAKYCTNLFGPPPKAN